MSNHSKSRAALFAAFECWKKGHNVSVPLAKVVVADCASVLELCGIDRFASCLVAAHSKPRPCSEPDLCLSLIESGLIKPALCKIICKYHNFVFNSKYRRARATATCCLTRAILPIMLLRLKYPLLDIKSVKEARWCLKKPARIQQLYEARALETQQLNLYLKKYIAHEYIEEEKAKYVRERNALTKSARDYLRKLFTEMPWLYSYDTVKEILGKNYKTAENSAQSDGDDYESEEEEADIIDMSAPATRESAEEADEADEAENADDADEADEAENAEEAEESA